MRGGFGSGREAVPWPRSPPGTGLGTARLAMPWVCHANPYPRHDTPSCVQGHLSPRLLHAFPGTGRDTTRLAVSGASLPTSIPRLPGGRPGHNTPGCVRGISPHVYSMPSRGPAGTQHGAPTPRHDWVHHMRDTTRCATPRQPLPRGIIARAISLHVYSMPSHPISIGYPMSRYPHSKLCNT